jgi:hypothetical protein
VTRASGKERNRVNVRGHSPDRIDEDEPKHQRDGPQSHRSHPSRRDGGQRSGAIDAEDHLGLHADQGHGPR